jgi:hypothetical protein
METVVSTVSINMSTRQLLAEWNVINAMRQQKHV